MTIDRTYLTNRYFLPCFWKVLGVTSGQPGAPIPIAGTSLDALPMPEKCTVIAVVIVLSAPLTAGLLRFEATKSGVGTGQTFDMRPANGTKEEWRFDPGEIILERGTEIGFDWGSNAAMTPSGSIDAYLWVVVQQA